MQIQNIKPNTAANLFGAIGIKYGFTLRSGRTELFKRFTGVYLLFVNTLSANSIIKSQKMRIEPVRKKNTQQIKTTSANARVSFSFRKLGGIVCSRICSNCCSILFLSVKVRTATEHDA